MYCCGGTVQRNPSVVKETHVGLVAVGATLRLWKKMRGPGISNVVLLKKHSQIICDWFDLWSSELYDLGLTLGLIASLHLCINVCLDSCEGFRRSWIWHVSHLLFHIASMCAVSRWSRCRVVSCVEGYGAAGVYTMAGLWYSCLPQKEHLLTSLTINSFDCLWRSGACSPSFSDSEVPRGLTVYPHAEPPDCVETRNQTGIMNALYISTYYKNECFLSIEDHRKKDIFF